MSPEAARRAPLLLAASCLLLGGARPISPPGQSAEAASDSCTQSQGQIITLTVASAVYRHSVATSVYLPPCYDWTVAPIPVIYLLHGANADETQWPDVGVQAAADALIAQGAPPFAVVMPAGPYLFGADYERFVLDDLMPGIEGQVLVSQSGRGRAIGGISLGGYWALKTAFEHPDLFAAVGGHSPVTRHSGGPDDPAALASSAPGLEGLQITLDVGDMDSLRVSTEQLAGTLRARGLAVALSVSRGGHNRTYWRAHTPDYLRFYVGALTAPAPAHFAADSFFWPHL